jgi:TonB family protein
MKLCSCIFPVFAFVGLLLPICQVAAGTPPGGVQQTSPGEADLSAGIEAFKKSNFKEAKKKLQEALKANPESKRAYQYLGSTLTTLGEYDAAIKLFKKYFAQWPQDDYAYRGNATIQLAEKKFDQALETARKAKELNPANYETDYLIACALIGLNRPYEARDAADSALTLKPDYENGLRVRIQAGYRLYAFKNGLIIRSGTFLDEDERKRLNEEKAELLRENVDSIHRFLLQPNAPNRQFWQEQAVQIGEFAEAIADYVKPGESGPANPNFQRPRVIKMDKPEYTEEARLNRVNGSVKMLVLVDEKGTVDKVLVVDGLPHGLTESAIKTVGTGKFKPALRDGVPVKSLAFMEVTYNIY